MIRLRVRAIGSRARSGPPAVVVRGTSTTFPALDVFRSLFCADIASAALPQSSIRRSCWMPNQGTSLPTGPWAPCCRAEIYRSRKIHSQDAWHSLQEHFTPGRKSGESGCALCFVVPCCYRSRIIQRLMGEPCQTYHLALHKNRKNRKKRPDASPNILLWPAPVF